MSERYTIALVGNPNCGKTTLFNALTGAKQRVGNWPGVTVERKSGEYVFEQIQFEVVDLPGTYSLDVVEHEVSLDERVARDYVHSNAADLIINIVDAANLERNLYLTSQLAEMQVPLLVVLNMVDVAESKGLQINVATLAAQLGCPVVPVVAAQGQGISDLRHALLHSARSPQAPTLQLQYNHDVEAALTELQPALLALTQSQPLGWRWLGVRLLEGDDLLRASATPVLQQQAQQLALQFGEDLDIILADARYTLANRIASQCVKVSGRVERDLSERIDRVVLNRFAGVPIFLLLMYLMFVFTISIGGAFIDFFDQISGALLVDGLGRWLESLGSPSWLTLLVANGIGGGVQVVATFIPVIAFLYLFLSLLEDSGYMARAAFVMDRCMRWIGLPGKSFVPLIVGFGCNVPAIMATRTLEHRRDRLMTIAMAPFMSCGARLPVYVLFAAAFFPESGQNLVFALYLLGIAVAVLTGLVLKNTLLQGEATPFIMELLPYHIPTLKSMLLHTWERLKGFIVRAGRVIVPMVLVLNVLSALGTDGSFNNQNSDKSVLASIGRSMAPLFAPMGLSADNWPATVGIFTGVLAKEAVVGTLNASYAALGAGADAATTAQEDAPTLGEQLSAALATVPENLGAAFSNLLDPLGLGVAAEVGDQAAIAEQVDASVSVFGAMAERFDGSAGALAYLLFILLYFPCTAALAAVYNEAGWRWTSFVAWWTTGVGYALATIYYQSATYTRHPADSLLWIATMLAAAGAAVGLLRWMGTREVDRQLALQKA